jgi:hypothetical protein
MTATTETAPAAPPLTAYHWVITLQGEAAGPGVVSATVDGTVTLPPGYSRQDAFQAVRREAQRLIRERPGSPRAGDPDCVLFFSLERDEL